MSGAANLFQNLADACLSQANMLQKIQASLSYKGPQIAALYANETALRAKTLVLNTAAVSAALQASEPAQAKLQSGTDAANKATAAIRAVGDAIQISADLISLAASAISANPDGIIGSASQLITDVGNITNA